MTPDDLKTIAHSARVSAVFPFVDSFGMRRNVLARMTFYIIVWITRGLVKLLPLGLRGVPAARRRE